MLLHVNNSVKVHHKTIFSLRNQLKIKKLTMRRCVTLKNRFRVSSSLPSRVKILFEHQKKTPSLAVFIHEPKIDISTSLIGWWVCDGCLWMEECPKCRTPKKSKDQRQQAASFHTHCNLAANRSRFSYEYISCTCWSSGRGCQKISIFMYSEGKQKIFQIKFANSTEIEYNICVNT